MKQQIYILWNALNYYFLKIGILKNIGSYVLISILLLNLILSINFILKEFDNFFKKIKQLIKIEESNKNNNDFIKINKTKNEKISIYKRKNKNKKKKYRIKDRKNEDKEKKDINFIIKENKLNNKMPPKKCKDSNDSLSHCSINNLKINKEIKSKISKEEPKIAEYNDYKLNNLENQKALEIDKRKYLEYYILLIKRKQIIIFTFYTPDDYNSKIIKISLFLFSFSIYFTINVLFFNDSTMHNIYEAKGSYKINFSNTNNIIFNYYFSYH